MTNLLTLTTPLMRQTVGFDRFQNLFESLLEDNAHNTAHSYPPYNIEKVGEDGYKIVMAVAGFDMENLEIVLDSNTLKVSGSIAKDLEEGDGCCGEAQEILDHETRILHRGIATRAFERSFNLADYIQVQNAELKNGLLTITLEREIPEDKKPRMIPIKTKDKAAKHISSRNKN